MLLVVAIIALLVALLFPVFSRYNWYLLTDVPYPADVDCQINQV